MALRKRWPLRVALAALLLLAAPVILPIPIPLDFARDRLAAAASAALGHDVRIGGARLTTGLAPALTLREIAVAGAGAVDAHIDALEADFLLLPLLAGELRVTALRAEGVTADLDSAAQTRAPPARAGGESALKVTLPRQVALRQATVTVRLAALAEPLRIALDEADAALTAAGGTRLAARGSVQALPATLAVETAPPAELLGGGSLPFDATLDLSGARIAAAGAWDRARGELTAAVTARAERPEELAAAFGAALPPAGALRLGGQLVAAPGRVAVEDLQLELGGSRVEGHVRYAAAGERALVAAALRAPVLDLAPWSGAGAAADQAPAARLAAALALPRRLDADVDVHVARLLTPLAEIGEATLTARSAQAVLEAALSARVDGVPLTAEVRVDAAGAAPALKLTGAAAGVPLGQIAQRLGRPELAGTAGQLTLGLEAAGADADALRAGFTLTATAAQVHLTERAPPQREVARLRTLRVDAGGDGESRARADGVLWGERFSVDLSTTRLGALLGGTPSPVRLKAALGPARLSAHGTLAQGERGAVGALELDAGARPIGPLHNLLPVNPASALDAALTGTLRLEASGITLRAATLRLGASRGRGTLFLPAAGERAPRRVELALESVDAAELAHALATAAAPAPRTAPPPDLAFDLTARSVRYREHRAGDVALRGELRGGRVAAAPFAARFGGTRVAGTLAADLRTAERRFDVEATASPLDLGAVLAWAGATGHAGSAERARLKASVRGAGAAELLRHASAELALERASLALPEFFTPKTLDFSAQAKLAPGEPLTATLQGNAGGTAVEASARLDDPGALRADAKASAFQVALSGADTSLQFAGTLGEARGRLALAGRNPADLAPLLDLDPPDLGPYRVDADLAWNGTRVTAQRFAVQLGESSAAGEFSVDWQGERPRVKASLTSPRVRFEDIGVKGPLREKPAAAPLPADEAAAERAARLAAWRAFLRAFDGEVRIDAQRVESGGELLGRGLYHERRENGRVEVSPLLVEAEGARLTVTGAVAAAADGDLRHELRANLESFDLAALVRGAGRESRGFGTLDARARLASRGLLEEFLVNASGEIDAMFIGEDLASGKLDLLTTGLLRLVSNTLHGERGSRVNCAVGDFVMTEGVIESQAFFIDTTRSRVAGDLRADLRTRDLSGLLQPRAKRPQLFSVATPLTIGGTMENPRVTVSPVGVATGTLRLYLFAPTLALDWLNARGLPEDGTPACREAFRKLAD